MWDMIDYENVHEKGLHGMEMLKKDNRIFMFYTMGDKENVENGKLREAAEKGISIQNIVLYKGGKNALDFYLKSRQNTPTSVVDERNIIGYSNAFGRVFSSYAQAEDFFSITWQTAV